MGNDEGHDNTGLVGRYDLGKPGLARDDVNLLGVDFNRRAKHQHKHVQDANQGEESASSTRSRVTSDHQLTEAANDISRAALRP